MAVFQYQALARVFDNPVVSSDISTEWYHQHPIPVLRLRAPTQEWFFAPTFLPFDQVFLQTITTIDQTFIHVFQYPSHASQVILRELTDSTDVSTEWYMQHPIPVLRIPVAWRTTISVGFIRELVEDDASHEWYMQHPIPVLRIPQEYFRSEIKVENVNPPSEQDTTVEWYMQHPIPVLRIISQVNRTTFVGDVLRDRRRIVPSLLVESVREVDGYSARNIRHEQLVARIMNSLILQGEIVQESGVPAVGVWHLGVQPTVATDWIDDVPPETVRELADRLAVAIRALAALLGSTIKP